MQTVTVIDSHTEGEPTRVVTSGGPSLGQRPLAEKKRLLSEQHDWLRSAVILEPRGNDVLVGALLCPPDHPESVAGIIFFNNVGYLHMCGHGMIGVVKTLEFLGKIGPGVHQIDSTVGRISAELHQDGSVSIQNVASYCWQKDVNVDVPGFGVILGDISWGGNWFFLVQNSPLEVIPQNIPQLTLFTTAIRKALLAQQITGDNGMEIDHIEVFGPALFPGNDSRNFVLCPGMAYDRSPCGTGTSAKLATLAKHGKLKPGQEWMQESIIGGLFRGSYHIQDDLLIPRITGRAFITAQASLILDPDDPFKYGIPGITP